jgi:hypothetical protein
VAFFPGVKEATRLTIKGFALGEKEEMCSLAAPRKSSRRSRSVFRDGDGNEVGTSDGMMNLIDSSV